MPRPSTSRTAEPGRPQFRERGTALCSWAERASCFRNAAIPGTCVEFARSRQIRCHPPHAPRSENGRIVRLPEQKGRLRAAVSDRAAEQKSCATDVPLLDEQLRTCNEPL